METTAPPPTASARNFALGLTLDSQSGLTPEIGRLAAGLALSAFYGLALGARTGGAELLRHALGVPLGLVVLGAVMAPSLTVLFAILDAPVRASRVLALLGRALSSVGLVLAGVAPGAALLVVSVESAELATLVARFGFVLAGTLALIQLSVSLSSELAAADRSVSFKSHVLLLGYALFSVMLAVRLWSLFVPLVGGAS